MIGVWNLRSNAHKVRERRDERERTYATMVRAAALHALPLAFLTLVSPP